ncbi:DUF2384 domain-containing protein [Parashewanella spongiae]|uniref:DUF2384 domain-containing protein n=1 Tax=Parashewanella spongiae TaxID=342950 RepID=A0A3A6TPN4_9GAMM|nr:MbcA/ParS/Xre antitoxin family protein [Parashewanella spongiae]MCL1078618.1 MbcA/ParS/Xre antitoxin family protein [Parashewanella spongiae]RJY13021.1 DUF2384 domain-containing protein [Parashewanella spongiae]
MNLPEANNNESIVGFKAAIKLLSSWDCEEKQIKNILNLDELSFKKFKMSPENALLNNEQLLRVSYLLNIHSALRTVFENPDNVVGFMSMKNNNEFFNGHAPIEILETGKLEDFKNVVDQIDRLILV